MWYAIMHDTGKVIAEESTYAEVSEAAMIARPWGFSPQGEVSPYYLTTREPTPCSICYGTRQVSDGYDASGCTHCEGTGYSFKCA